MSTKQAIRALKETTVAIIKNRTAYRAQIVYPDMPDKMKNNMNEQIVYTRSFPELIDALGYCTTINMLSNASIKRLIAMKNAKQPDTTTHRDTCDFITRNSK